MENTEQPNGDLTLEERVDRLEGSMQMIQDMIRSIYADRAEEEIAKRDGHQY